jgi:hypothetical protein
MAKAAMTIVLRIRVLLGFLLADCGKESDPDDDWRTMTGDSGWIGGGCERFIANKPWALKQTVASA